MIEYKGKSSVVLQDTVKQYIERSMYDTVYHHYYRKQTFTDVFDGLQETFQCCGVHSYKDWLHSYYATQAHHSTSPSPSQKQDGLDRCEGSRSWAWAPPTRAASPRAAATSRASAPTRAPAGRTLTRCPCGPTPTSSTPALASPPPLLLGAGDAVVAVQGCSDMLYDKFYHNLDIMIGLAVGIGAFQVTLLLLALKWVGEL